MDSSGRLASEVEFSTGVTVLPHSTKKPGCGPEIMEYFRKYPETGVTRPEQVAVVGDRLTTDIMMANHMGSYAVWVKDGVVPPEESSAVSTICNWQALLTKSLLVCAYGA
jgi:phosphatidylglycerophosphatase GEP4